ncbi:MAG TPA: arylamine N-acetyltransferase, partial [Steroidobacteraceae bacterium]|nr:arylamine N-acetyltransferase [Steroidobacteraceae bacterium]
QATGLAARVLWNAVDENAPRPRSHMLLQIDDLAGKRYIADVGFGGLTLTAPLLLQAGSEQATPHETFRLMERDAGVFTLQALVRDNWKSLYSFDLQPQGLPDYEVSSWYLENHPQSPFANRLLVARAEPDRRYAMLNNKLSIHPLQGESEQTTLRSPADMRQALEQIFRIRLPEDPGLDGVLAGVMG